MTPDTSLNRFISAQEKYYATALAEITKGRKQTHWMWFIFPQIRGLGFSEYSKLYAIQDIQEATAYLQHPLLGKRLKEISLALLQHTEKTVTEILGSPDDMKLRSSMTLFASVQPTDTIFQIVLDKFFNGSPDLATLQLI